MLKITDGKSILKVPKSSFESVYKNMGFRLFNETLKEESAGHDLEENKLPEFVLEFAKKDKASWTKEEMKAVADVLKVDTSSAKNVGEAKEFIEKELKNLKLID